MDGLERQQFVREQRELAAREAKKARAELARRRAALPRGEDLLEQREGREQPRAFRAEREPDKTGMIYKTRDSTAAASPAPDAEESIADERQFIFDVVAEFVAELSARHQAEIDALRDKVDDLKRAFFNTPRDMVEGARELSAQTDKVLAAVADLRAASERDQQRRSTDVLDLPALPLRRPN